jgi:tRNA pseudouridine38-40 synthase
MNYRLKIQYDGSRYRGWQRQKTTENTIQGRIEKVLERLTGETIEIHGAGRTDAGVHALCQVANFHCSRRWDENELKEQLNEYLPEDIRIMEVSEAGERFHSRLNAVGKVYEYHLIPKGGCNVFARKYSWQQDAELDIESMRKAAEKLEGCHDFKGFCSKASKKKSTVRRIDSITIFEKENDICLRFEGNGFLYNMVRILTGTLVEIGSGVRKPDTIDEVFAGGERRLAGETAPAQGLTLVSVKYD